MDSIISDGEKKFKSECPKGILYQYRNVNTIENHPIYDLLNLEKKQLYFGLSQEMNDPYDSKLSLSSDYLLKEMINKLINDTEPNMTPIVSLLYPENIGLVDSILSFSDSLNNNNPINSCLLNAFEDQIKNHSSLSDSAKSGLRVFLKFIKENKWQTEEYRKTKESFSQCKNLFDKAQEAIESTKPSLDKLSNQFYISCFSNSGWNNKLMWAHYADSFAGLCIGYDFRKVSSNVLFKKVDYVIKRRVLTLEDFGYRINQGKLESFKEPIDFKTFLPLFYTKSSDWEYEKEWRLIYIKDKLAPFYLLPAPRIDSITIGPRLSFNLKRFISDVSTAMGIKCFELTLNDEDYYLKRKITNYYSQNDNEYKEFLKSIISEKPKSNDNEYNEYLEINKKYAIHFLKFL
jgi:hypothetical protein